MEYPAVIGRVLEFLEVVFHTILAVRNVYPSESFTKARKYDLVVRKSRHPGLCSYISDFLAGIKEDCIKGVVDRVMLVIVDEGFNPVQKYVFRIRDVMEQLTFESKKSSVTTVTDLALEEYFRDILTKISFSQSSLADNPPDCTFQLYCELQKHVDHPSSYLKSSLFRCGAAITSAEFVLSK
ncbi:DNA-binding protein [Zopfochytrium polystomum]|nr:DNA-binding protein [Zopfochytrium polystomum]